MSDTSPSDLAVAFRSLPRRLREAGGTAPTATTDPFEREIHRLLARCAELLHAGPDPLLIADAIDAIHADEWDEAVLDGLRSLSLELGRTLRTMAAAVEALGGRDD